MTTRRTLDIWPIDLTFPSYMDAWARLGEEFEKAHPEYRVNIRGLDFFTGPQQVAEAIAEGHPPAAAEYYFYMSQVAMDTRAPDGGPQFVSIEKAIDGRTDILGEPVVIDDIIPAMREYYTVRGDLVCMPSVGTTSVLYADADALEYAGLTRMPRTWDEVEAACETIAGRRPGPSITWANHGMFFQQALASQGGLLANNHNGRAARATAVDLASPQMLAWINWWQRLHKNGHYLHTDKIPDWQGTFGVFAQRRVPFRLSSSNDVNYMVAAAKGAGFGIEVSGYPRNSHVPYVGNGIAGSSFWLSDRLEDATRDGALAFLQFAHNPRNAAERHKANSFLPLTQASFELLEREGWFDAHPYHRAATDQLRTHPERPEVQWPPSEGAVFGEFARVQDIMTRAARDVLTRGVDPAEHFARATEAAQRLLDAYNAACFATAPGSGPLSLRVEYFSEADATYSGADLDGVVRGAKAAT